MKQVVLMLPSLHLKAFNTVLSMFRNLISDPTEQFSKLIFVRKILLHRPWEEKSITPILKNVWSFMKDLNGIFCVLSGIRGEIGVNRRGNLYQDAHALYSDNCL